MYQEIGAIVSLFSLEKWTFGPIEFFDCIRLSDFIGKTANKLIPIHITFPV